MAEGSARSPKPYSGLIICVLYESEILLSFGHDTFLSFLLDIFQTSVQEELG